MTEHDTVESKVAPENVSTTSDPTANSDALTQEINELKQRLADAESKAAEHRDAMLRAKAESDNVRRRSERDVENAHKFALERFAQELLPVIDSVEMGMQAAQANDVSVESIRQGSELILKKFEAVLGKFNLNVVNPLDQPFNPELHQAVSMVPGNGKAPNTVISVLQKGYTLNDRLIRPAMVVVAQG